MIGQVSDTVECLPPCTFTELCARLSLKERVGRLTVSGQVREVLDSDFLLTLVGTGEDLVVVLNQSLRSETLGREELCHLLVLRKLLVCDTKGFLHLLRVELRTVVQFARVRNLLTQRKSQSVVADHTDRSESNVNRLTVLVRVREQKVRVNLVTTKDVEGLLDLGECPDHLTTFQRTGGVHFHVTRSAVLCEEVKRLFVLYRVPTRTDLSQNLVVRRTDKGLLSSRNVFQSTETIVNDNEGIVLLNRPIQTSFLHHLTGSQIVRYRNT